MSSNGNFPSSSLRMIFELDSPSNVRPVHRSAFLLLWWGEGNSHLLTPICDTDAPDSRFNLNDNRLHANAPFSYRLCIRGS
jgi:hypothetical protein